MNELPTYYYRIRENGAAVFKTEPDNRLQRIEMTQIAVVNVRKAEIKPHGDYELSEDDTAEISSWIEARNAVLQERQIEDILRTVDHLNLTTGWVQSKATHEEIEQVADALLLAMHDLRSVLVRKKADRLKSD